ncbi:hypothetical protein H9P43_005772 [Blastocladiella emersonii ATCC 22665]|nr:hypothetical protein H9P43_005772 [Blastocladiella emersonii ATCC 22665]
MVALSCGHILHKECAEGWVRPRKACHMCRKQGVRMQAIYIDGPAPGTQVEPALPGDEASLQQVARDAQRQLRLLELDHKKATDELAVAKAEAETRKLRIEQFDRDQKETKDRYKAKVKKLMVDHERKTAQMAREHEETVALLKAELADLRVAHSGVVGENAELRSELTAAVETKEATAKRLREESEKSARYFLSSQKLQRRVQELQGASGTAPNETPQLPSTPAPAPPALAPAAKRRRLSRTTSETITHAPAPAAVTRAPEYTSSNDDLYGLLAEEPEDDGDLLDLLDAAATTPAPVPAATPTGSLPIFGTGDPIPIATPLPVAPPPRRRVPGFSSKALDLLSEGMTKPAAGAKGKLAPAKPAVRSIDSFFRRK